MIEAGERDRLPAEARVNATAGADLPHAGERQTAHALEGEHVLRHEGRGQCDQQLVLLPALRGPDGRPPPPTRAPTSAAAAPAPVIAATTSSSPASGGTVRATRMPAASAPSAARSERAAAAARHPISSSESHSRRKCTPSTL